MAGVQNQTFITLNEFQASSSRITKWGDLPLNVVYRVTNVRQRIVNINGEDVTSKYAVLENQAGEVINVWLTSVIVEELNDVNDFENQQIYIRSYGLKSNKAGNRKYYDFEIVKRN